MPPSIFAGITSAGVYQINIHIPELSLGDEQLVVTSTAPSHSRRRICILANNGRIFAAAPNGRVLAAGESNQRSRPWELGWT
jgi:hypothetical protein